MRHKTEQHQAAAERTVKNIRPKTRKHYSSEEKIRIVLAGLRDEDSIAERGLDISYETIRRWFLKFGSVIAANVRRTRPRPSNHWHLNEIVIVIQRRCSALFSPQLCRKR